MNPTLLELERVRCSRADVNLLDNLTLRTTGNRVGLSGRTEGVAALLMGEARLVAGTFNVLGRSLEQARQQRLFGCALAPNGVPPKWTVRRILELAAEVAGYSRPESRLRAMAAAEKVGEGALSKRPWPRCSPLEKALASLALGLVCEPALLFVRLPIGELEVSGIARYSEALARAVDGIALLAEIRRPPVLQDEESWISGLDAVVYVFDAGSSGDLAPPSRGKMRYLLRVAGERDVMSAALQRFGLMASAINAPSDVLLGRSAFLVDVEVDSNARADTGPLLDLCVALDLDVLELTPVARVSSQ